MKNNNEMPAKENSKKDDPNKMSKEKTNRTPERKNEDLGSMKIGKSHSMDDNNVSINWKERKSK